MESAGYRVDDRGGVWRLDGRRLDPWMWTWERTNASDVGWSGDAEGVSAREALSAAVRAGARALPVGVIGPREATPSQLEAARDLGHHLAGVGLPVVCGGRSGVMAAVSAGARAAGGLTIGLLPDTSWRTANADIVLPLATGLGEVRNVVIARACVVLVAIGGSYGTLTEVAYGLHFGRPVIGLLDPPAVDGLIRVGSVAEAMDHVAESLLALPDMSQEMS